MGWPKRVSSSAMARVDLLVHLSRLMGSPAVVSSRMRVRCCPIEGATCSAFLRPPPGWRTLPACAVFSRRLPRNSLTPFVMVTRDMPVSRASRLTPPRPNSIARSATNKRAWYSLRVPRTRNQRDSVGGGDVPARPSTCMFPRYPKSIELYRLFLSRPYRAAVFSALASVGRSKLHLWRQRAGVPSHLSGDSAVEAGTYAVKPPAGELL